MAGKLYDSNGNFIGTIEEIVSQFGEPTTVLLTSGHKMTFGSEELVRDPFLNYHIKKKYPRKAKDALDAHCYADAAYKRMETVLMIKNVIFNPPATVVYWSDGTKTVVKCSANDMFDPEKGLAMCIAKRCANNSGSYYKTIQKWIGNEPSYKANFADAPKEKTAVPTSNPLLKKYVDKADADLKAFVDAATTGDAAKVLLIFGALNADLELLKSAITK